MLLFGIFFKLDTLKYIQICGFDPSRRQKKEMFRVCQVLVFKMYERTDSVEGQVAVPSWLYEGFYSKSLNMMVFDQNTKY